MAIPLALAASETGKIKYLTAVHTFQKFREDHPRDLVILVIISQQRIPSSLQEDEAFLLMTWSCATELLFLHLCGQHPRALVRLYHLTPRRSGRWRAQSADRDIIKHWT